MKEDLDEVWLNHILSITNCKTFIDNLPFGLKTQIGSSGMNLSAGQKQRILIARALYKKPDILLFDEATSSLDTANESQITTNLKSFFKGRTGIIIAHRLSTVMDADKILVMDQGNIVEEGNHKELIDQKGYYYNLIKQQLV